MICSTLRGWSADAQRVPAVVRPAPQTTVRADPARRSTPPLANCGGACQRATAVDCRSHVATTTAIVALLRRLAEVRASRANVRRRLRGIRTKRGHTHNMKATLGCGRLSCC